VRRPIGEGFAYWFRHRTIKRAHAGFACPLWAVGAFAEPPLYEKLRKLAPDLIVTCGFPRRLPAALAHAAARYGAVNLHPALLPMDRGPQPLFWCFRRGDAETGVTLHALSDGLDEGDIIAQRRIPVPRGIGGAELSADLGKLAGELLIDQLPPRSGVPQGESNDWARKPTHADWEIKPDDWRAEHLWHFVRGARMWGSPWARLADEIYYFDDALAVHTGMQVPGEFVVVGRELLLRVQDGAVRLRLLV
jgi:methionyl-tRNA formyltransferase